MPSKISVETSFGTFKNAPNTNWDPLKPLWPDIVASIIEVVLENNFNLNPVNKSNREGFIAPHHMWSKHRIYPKAYSLNETRRFLKLLKEKPRFVHAIKTFNSNQQVNWLLDENLRTLGGYVYSFCFYLLEYLQGLKLLHKHQYL